MPLSATGPLPSTSRHGPHPPIPYLLGDLSPVAPCADVQSRGIVTRATEPIRAPEAAEADPSSLPVTAAPPRASYSRNTDAQSTSPELMR
jgi:hypothetical protein